MEKRVYVKLDDYEDITEVINMALEKLTNARAVLAKIKEFYAREKEMIARWEADIDMTERDILSVKEGLKSR